MSHDRRAFLSLGGATVVASALSAGGAPRRDEDSLETELARLRRVDPGLFGYDEVDRVVLDLREPLGIASGGGSRLWVVGDRALVLYVGGRESLRVPLASAPSCACESPDGSRVYVGLGDHVEVLSISGEPVGRWPSHGENGLITSIAAGEGYVFVADAARRAVQRRDAHGRELGRIGDERGSTSHFVVPSAFLDLAVAPAGVLWVTNPGLHRVEGYDFDGSPRESFGMSGAAIGEFCGCCNPTHLAVLPDGRLVTSEKGLARVKVMHPSGALDCVVAAGERLAPGIVGLDLATDAVGRVLVLDPKQRAVRVFAARDKGGACGHGA
jgi:hypothetical protein